LLSFSFLLSTTAPATASPSRMSFFIGVSQGVEDEDGGGPKRT
jgi:hypothetical protein